MGKKPAMGGGGGKKSGEAKQGKRYPGEMSQWRSREKGAQTISLPTHEMTCRLSKRRTKPDARRDLLGRMSGLVLAGNLCSFAGRQGRDLIKGGTGVSLCSV